MAFKWPVLRKNNSSLQQQESNSNRPSKWRVRWPLNQDYLFINLSQLFQKTLLGRRNGHLEGTDNDVAHGRYNDSDAEREDGDVDNDAYGDGDDGGRTKDGRSLRHGRQGHRGRHFGRTRSDSPTDERLLRHEMCFESFNGYDEDYSGPRGILTSHLPDGTSTLAFGKLQTLGGC